MTKIVAILSLIFSVAGILWLHFFSSRVPKKPKGRVNLYVIDSTGVINEALFNRFLDGYPDVMQVSPTMWYVVSPLSLFDIAKRLMTEHAGLKITIYQVVDVLSHADRSVLDWLLSKGLNKG